MNSNIQDGMVIYSSQGNIMFSSAGEIITEKKPPRKHRIQKNIINHDFDKMREFNKEEFWDNILMKFSRNIFPKDFRFHNNILYYKMKAKKYKDEIFIDNQCIEDTFFKLKGFLRDKGIIPVKEITDDSEELFCERKIIESWRDAGKNKLFLIREFIDDMRDKYDLNSKEKKYLESLIKITIYNDVVNNDHIVIEKERIKSIKHLCWNEKKRQFYIDINMINIKSTKTEKKDNEKFYTISSFSDDTNIVMGKEIEVSNIEKKWDDFFESFYCKKI